MLSSHGRNASSVKRDQRGDERTLVAKHQRLRDEFATLDDILDRARGDVLAAGGDDEILLASDDVQEAIVVNAAQVAGLVPAILGKGILGGLAVLMVLREHRSALDLNLPILGDTQLETRERDADGTLMIRHAKHVERARRGGFGQSVAFVDRTPAPRKNANNSGSSGAPPATIHLARPPSTSRSEA